MLNDHISNESLFNNNALNNIEIFNPNETIGIPLKKFRKGKKHGSHKS